MEITQIPTELLVAHRANAHSQLRNIPELAATIEVHGILQPLTVIRTESEDGTDRYTINAGHRRHAAAVHLGLESVPCVVADSRDEAEQFAVMLVENLHREGLSTSEEAAVYEQMALLDWEPEQIAKATGTDVQRVTESLALRTLPKSVQEAADTGDIDLAEAAALTVFAGDQPTIDKVLKKAGSGYWGLRHAIKDEQDRRERKREIEQLKARLTLDGVTVTSAPKTVGSGGTAVVASELVDADGTPIDPDAVKTLPGFAAYIDKDARTPASVVYCTDPVAYGYTPRKGTRAADRTSDEERKAEREAREAAIAAATEVRHEFLKARYTTAKAAKTFLRPALRRFTMTTMSMPYGPLRELANALTGVPITEIPENASMDRLTRAAAARWIAYQEDNLQHCSMGFYRPDLAAAMAYLDQLVADGYTLSDFETERYNAFADQRAEEARAEEEDEDDTAEDDEETLETDDGGETPADDEAAAEGGSDVLETTELVAA